MIHLIVRENFIEGEIGRACDENKADTVGFDIFFEVPVARA